MRVAKQAIGLNIVRAVLKSKRRTEERMMPGNCREEEKKQKKEKMKKRRQEEGCFENSFASSTMRGPPMTYVNDEKKSLGKESNNQNGNLRWHLPLGVRPPPPQWTKKGG